LHDAPYAAVDGGAQDVVAAHDVVGVERAVVDVVARVRDRAKVDHAVELVCEERVDVGERAQVGWEERRSIGPASRSCARACVPQRPVAPVRRTCMVCRVEEVEEW
jgi:predicted transcriptional regulator